MDLEVVGTLHFLFGKKLAKVWYTQRVINCQMPTKFSHPFGCQLSKSGTKNLW